jgi:hypothetical protein
VRVRQRNDFRHVSPCATQRLRLIRPWNTQLFPAVPDFQQPLDAARVSTVDDRQAELSRVRAEWASFHDDTMFTVVSSRSRPVYRMGRFTLSRFLPP